MKTTMKLRKTFRRSALAAALITGIGFAPSAFASGFALVTNNQDSGPGSLRHALEVQEASYIYVLRHVSDIHISSTLTYDEEKTLSIFAHGQTVETDQDVTLLALTEGANLNIYNLDFEGPGTFSINNQGTGKGIFVDVRDDQEGKVKMNLNRVSVSGVANHGIHISDCSLADDCGGGSGGGGEGSPASIYVNFNKVTIDDAGNGKFDADGLRVDDRGEGSIYFTARRSTFTDVGADGVELDEGNDGDVFINVSRSAFTNNGGYCDPAILDPFVPSDMEFELADEVSEDDVISSYGSPDDACIELEVSFFDDTDFVEEAEYGLDLDDGIDLDEAGEGSLIASMTRSTISGNLDEGVDFDEEDAGDVSVSFRRTKAFDNNDDGYKMSEEDEGSVTVTVNRSSAKNNGGKGFVFEEEDEGDLYVSVNRTHTANNDDSDDTGIEAVQEDEGEGKLRVRNSSIEDGIDTDGVDEI